MEIEMYSPEDESELEPQGYEFMGVVDTSGPDAWYQVALLVAEAASTHYTDVAMVEDGTALTIYGR